MGVDITGQTQGSINVEPTHRRMRGILLGGLVEHTGFRFCFSCALGSGSKHSLKCTQIIYSLRVNSNEVHGKKW